METPVEEFVRLPYYSNAACHPVEFDGKPYLVLRLRLSPPNMKPDPDHDPYVKFVLGHDQARQLSRGLLNGIDGVLTLY